MTVASILIFSEAFRVDLMMTSSTLNADRLQATCHLLGLQAINDEAPCAGNFDPALLLGTASATTAHVLNSNPCLVFLKPGVFSATSQRVRGSAACVLFLPRRRRPRPSGRTWAGISTGLVSSRSAAGRRR